MKRFLVAAIAVSLVGAFLFPRTALARNMKVDVCHRTGNGSYHLISISEKDVAEHIAKHGDGLPGDDVPGMEGYAFSEECLLGVPISSSGGSITNADGTVSVSVPPGAVSEEVVITIGPSKEDPDAVAAILPIVDIGPEETTFDRLVTVTIAYDPETIPDGVAEEELTILQEGPHGWQAVATVVDTENHVATAKVWHFSLFFLGAAIVVGGAIVIATAVGSTYVAHQRWQPDEDVEFVAECGDSQYLVDEITADEDGTVERLLSDLPCDPGTTANIYTRGYRPVLVRPHWQHTLVEPVTWDVPIPDTIFAIAYTNVDGVRGFDEEAGDVLIAKLVDGPESSPDGHVGAGDIVVTHRYPTNFSAPWVFGNFQVTTHALDWGSGSDVEVFGQIGAGNFFFWTHDPTFEWERYEESSPAAFAFTTVVDSLGAFVAQEGTSAYSFPTISDPDTLGDFQRASDSSDNAHVDVEINFVPPPFP